jgi:hypothetical protein
MRCFAKKDGFCDGICIVSSNLTAPTTFPKNSAKSLVLPSESGSTLPTGRSTILSAVAASWKTDQAGRLLPDGIHDRSGSSTIHQFWGTPPQARAKVGLRTRHPIETTSAAGLSIISSIRTRRIFVWKIGGRLA